MKRLILRLLGRRSPARLVAHRKSHVLVEISRPFPRRLLGGAATGGTFGLGPWSIRTGAGIPVRRRAYSSWPFVRLGSWREWYFPPLLVVWRKGDQVRVQFWPWIHLRDWLFTRCEGCGKRLRYGSSAVHLHGHDAITKSVQLGRTGSYHFDCAPDRTVDHRNTETWDRQWGHDLYLRRTVLNEPIDVAVELAALRTVAREAEERYRRRLWETRKEHALDWQWRFPREENKEGVHA